VVIAKKHADQVFKIYFQRKNEDTGEVGKGKWRVFCKDIAERDAWMNAINKAIDDLPPLSNGAATGADTAVSADVTAAGTDAAAAAGADAATAAGTDAPPGISAESSDVGAVGVSGNGKQNAVSTGDAGKTSVTRPPTAPDSQEQGDEGPGDTAKDASDSTTQQKTPSTGAGDDGDSPPEHCLSSRKPEAGGFSFFSCGGRSKSLRFQEEPIMDIDMTW